MKQVLGRLVALILLGVVIAIGAIPFDSSGGSDTADPSTITDYRADFTVAANGDLRAVETLKVDFPPGRHGIFRFFDVKDPNHARNRLIPTDIRVARDGANEPYEKQSRKRGRIVVLKIGSAGTTLSGEHTYQIGYRIKGALTPGTDAPTQFYWNLIPQGWQMPISRSRLTVALPATAEHVRCAIGLGAAATGCRIEGEGTRNLVVETGGIGPRTPITVQAGMDIPTPDADTRPWPYWLDPVLGRSVVGAGLVLALGLILGAAGFALSMSTWEKTPPYPLMYAPPEGIGPAQAAYILTEEVDKKAFVATMMYAAERGVVKLDQQDRTWKVTGAADSADWQALDGVTAGAGRSLGVMSPGTTFAASPSSVSAGKELKSALSSFTSDTEGWAKTSGLMIGSGLGGFGVFVLFGLLALTVFLGAFNPLNMSLLALLPGLFGIGALGVGATGAGTKRTPAGRDLWSRVGGFHRILSTPSAKDRFDFAGRKDLYTAYLPWAVAFDCADEWAKKYRVETGEEPPTPTWFPAYYGAHTGAYVSSMVDSFDSAVSSAISSYDATQSSSSSGGGGFSGGGGGGGGGGGSW